MHLCVFFLSGLMRVKDVASEDEIKEWNNAAVFSQLGR